jgi:hypothetical protein
MRQAIAGSVADRLYFDPVPMKDIQIQVKGALRWAGAIQEYELVELC